MYPEHTALAYRMASEQGADMIECDLAITKDFQFICSHEPWLSWNTDIESRSQFADRKRTYNMDDDDPLINWNDKGNITDWFSFDFTLEELQTLRKKQSQEFRDPRFDFEESVVTLQELVDIVREYGELQNRVIGIYIELKHSAAINKIYAERGIDRRFEDVALEALQDLGYTSKSDPCFLQSFELTSLEYVKDKTDLKLVFLLERNIDESDWQRIDNLDLSGLGFDKGGLVTLGADDDKGRGKYLTEVTHFIDEIHQHNLEAHGFTFRNEWMKLYWDHGQDPYSQLKQFLDLGIDGYFTDFPLTVRRFLKYEGRLCGSGSGDRYPNIALTILSVIIATVRIL